MSIPRGRKTKQNRAAIFILRDGRHAEARALRERRDRGRPAQLVRLRHGQVGHVAVHAVGRGRDVPVVVARQAHLHEAGRADDHGQAQHDGDARPEAAVDVRVDEAAVAHDPGCIYTHTHTLGKQ